MFELWDAELGVSLGTFATEREAFAAIKQLCEFSPGSHAPLGLIQDGHTLVASGEALVQRANQGSGCSL